MTSEIKYGIIPPVAHACPEIDDMVSLCDKWSYLFKNPQDVSEEEFATFSYEMGSMVDRLEVMRGDFESLRAWGETWKKLSKNFIEVNSLSDFEVRSLVEANK